MSSFKESLLEGRPQLPERVLEKLTTPDKYELVNEFVSSLWHNTVKNLGSTSLCYWSDKFDNSITVFNRVIKGLGDMGLVSTEVLPRFSSVKLNVDTIENLIGSQTLLSLRANIKTNKVMMSNRKSRKTRKTRTIGGKIDTGLERKGFEKTNSTEFLLDTKYLVKYYEYILLNLTKGIRKLKLDYGEFHDSLDYKSISKDVLDLYIACPYAKYCPESGDSDSRGRNIYTMTKYLGNPIASKDFRSVLEIPVQDRVRAESSHTKAIYLFIAELNGGKFKSTRDKEIAGEKMYLNRVLPDLDGLKDIDITLDEHNSEDLHLLKDLHESIWLQRLYAELDAFWKSREDDVTYYWSVPIEVDATASMIGITGSLLGHEPYLDLTNTINDDELKDMWSVDYMSRLAFKYVATPRGYGSKESPVSLLSSKGISVTQEQVRAINKEITTGRLSVMDKFKDFIIDNCKPKAEQLVDTYYDQFTIFCNKFKHEAEYFKKYTLWDTESKSLKPCHITVQNKKPDVSQFSTFFVTCLIHNLDSRGASNVCNKLDWCISIHDAWVISPAEADKCRMLYGKFSKGVYNDRHNILNNYFKSVGIDMNNPKTRNDWNKLLKLIKPVESDWKPSYLILK